MRPERPAEGLRQRCNGKSMCRSFSCTTFSGSHPGMRNVLEMTTVPGFNSLGSRSANRDMAPGIGNKR